jgi:hypothetical protein
MLVDLTTGNPLTGPVTQEFFSTLVSANTHVLQSPEGHRCAVLVCAASLLRLQARRGCAIRRESASR